MITQGEGGPPKCHSFKVPVILLKVILLECRAGSYQQMSKEKQDHSEALRIRDPNYLGDNADWKEITDPSSQPGAVHFSFSPHRCFFVGELVERSGGIWPAVAVIQTMTSWVPVSIPQEYPHICMSISLWQRHHLDLPTTQRSTEHNSTQRHWLPHPLAPSRCCRPQAPA